MPGHLVHAETTEARDFYLHFVPEFEASPTDELHLYPPDEGHSPNAALTSPPYAGFTVGSRPELRPGDVASVAVRSRSDFYTSSTPRRGIAWYNRLTGR